MDWLSKLPFLKKHVEKGKTYHRNVRVSLYHNDVYFRPSQSGSERLINVANISMGGMALERNKAIFWPPCNELFPGEISLGETCFDITSRIIHLSEGLVGCEFKNAPRGFLNYLKDYLKVEFTARTLVRIQDEVLSHEIKGTPFYFYSRLGDEAYFIVAENEIQFASFIVDKEFLSIGKGLPLKTGEVIKDLNNEPHGYKRIDPVSWAVQPSPDIMSKAMRFVDNIELMPVEHRKLLIEKLKSYT